MISAFSRASARCCATRTAPAVLPTASAVSSALMPTTTRRIRISRCFSGSIASSLFIRADDSASRAICSGPASTENRSGTTSVGSERFLAGCAMRVSNLVSGDAVHEGQERSSLILVARQRRDGGQAHLLSDVVC